MSMNRYWIVISSISIVVAAPAVTVHAQDGQPDRFFSDKVTEAEAEGEAPSETVFQGSLTSSTFFYTESGDTITDAAGVPLTNNASPASRLYTDLRAQVDARYLGGSSWNARADARARLSTDCTFNSLGTGPTDCRNQSGLYGDNEYDVRELYIRRAGESFDVQLGRQYVLELAATKIDGLRLQYQTSEKLAFLGFAGLYPARGSRSLTEDYPTQTLAGGVMGDRVLPVAGGFGASYRLRNMYGSVGGVGILPMAKQVNLGGIVGDEPLRLFATSNGYWRQSSTLDFYHFAILDVTGSNGTSLTNLSAGINYRPSQTMRISASINHVDTETLNVIAQNRLEDAGANLTPVQNNVEVLRIASQSARVGVSSSFREQRFEVSVAGQLRRRPDITLNNAAAPVTINSARAGEIMLSVLDRRSVANFRLGASLLSIFSLGGTTYANNQSALLRLHGSHEFKQGLGEYEAEVNYLFGKDTDANVNVLCAAANTCFGTSNVGTLSVGGSVYYRFSLDWLAMANASVARQAFSTLQAGANVAQPANLLVSGFLRIAYRF